jgi:SAM-dependent methyltransferase
MSATTRTVPADQMESDEIARIRAEYERRRREIPADFYSWSRDVNFFYHSQIARASIRALREAGRYPLNGCKVLDAGCGSGAWLLEFAQWGADQLHGLDLDPGRLDIAARMLPGADLRCGDARALPWPDECFDLVSQFTMFTSILDADVKRSVAGEMLRVLKRDGMMLWYDFRINNPANRNVRGIEAAEIRSLFPGCDVTLKRTTLAPPIARRIVPVTWIGALLLEQIPWLRTHYVAVIRRSAAVKSSTV